MRQLIIISLLLGWFWGVRLLNPDGGFINVVVGPFASKLQCEADQAFGLKLVQQLFDDIVKVANCQSMVEA